MTAGLAFLPMYDWPEVAEATDRFWTVLRDHFRSAGIAAPEALTRGVGLMRGWTDPRLVLGQTCGLPLVRTLAGRVTVLGAADHGVPGCAPGWYRSAVVVRADDPRPTLEAFRGGRLVVSGFDSQSGWGAILHHAAPLARDGGFFGTVGVSGEHAASVAQVADGKADLAAIDFVSWRLARRYRSEALGLRVLMLTDPTPGLPYITALAHDAPRYRSAVRAAIDDLDIATRTALGITGFAPLTAADYRVVAERITAAESVLPPAQAAPPASASKAAATATAPASGTPVRSVPLR